MLDDNTWHACTDARAAPLKIFFFQIKSVQTKGWRTKFQDCPVFQGLSQRFLRMRDQWNSSTLLTWLNLGLGQSHPLSAGGGQVKPEEGESHYTVSLLKFLGGVFRWHRQKDHISRGKSQFVSSETRIQFPAGMLLYVTNQYLSQHTNLMFNIRLSVEHLKQRKNFHFPFVPSLQCANKALQSTFGNVNVCICTYPMQWPHSLENYFKPNQNFSIDQTWEDRGAKVQRFSACCWME